MRCFYCKCDTDKGYVCRSREGNYFWTVDPYGVFKGPAIDEDIILVLNKGTLLETYLHNMRTDGERCPVCERIYIGKGDEKHKVTEILPQGTLREVR